MRAASPRQSAASTGQKVALDFLPNWHEYFWIVRLDPFDFLNQIGGLFGQRYNSGLVQREFAFEVVD